MLQEGHEDIGVTVRSPRSLWASFILNFSTLGVYPCFWLVARVKELNSILDKKFTPWLWFFVPIFVIAQLIALPKFFKALTELENRVDPDSSNNSANRIWILLLVLFTIVFNISDKFELPGWTFSVSLIVWSLLFTYMQDRINRVKDDLSDLSFTGARTGFSVFEWILVIPLFPIALLLAGYLIASPFLVDEIKSLKNVKEYVDSEKLYSIPIIGDSWSIVETGTFSDDESELELKGKLKEMYFVVFRHDADDTFDGIARFRISNAQDGLGGNICNEERTFVENKLSVTAMVTCEGRYLGDQSLLLSSIIKTDKGIFELYGSLTSVRISYKANKGTMIEMARGFKPL